MQHTRNKLYTLYSINGIHLPGNNRITNKFSIATRDVHPNTTRTLYTNDNFLEKLPLYPTSGLLLLEALSGLAHFAHSL